MQTTAHPAPTARTQTLSPRPPAGLPVPLYTTCERTDAHLSELVSKKRITHGPPPFGFRIKDFFYDVRRDSAQITRCTTLKEIT